MFGAIFYWVAFIGGVLVGWMVKLLYLRLTTKSGYLLIDDTNPEKPIWRIDLNNLLDDNTKKFILEIKRNVDLSQR